jgi:hypothetical protein
MMREPPANDPQVLWQNQRREHRGMSLEEVRIQAHVVQLKARQGLIVSFITGFLLAALCIALIIALPFTAARIVGGAILGLTLAIIYKAYRRMWSRYQLVADAAVTGCVEFYRRQLQTQYRSLQLIWRFVVPIVIFAFFLWGSVFRTNPLVARVLPPVVLLLIMFERRREARKINRMLAALAEFEKENT